MKKVIAILVFFSLTFTWASAQTFEINQVERISINGVYKSFLFDLPDVDEAQAEQDWKKLMEGFGTKTRYDRKNNIWSAENVNISQLTSSVINVYANIYEEEYPEKRTSVIVWFAMGEDHILSDTDSLMKKGDSFNDQYAIEILTKYAVTTSRNQAQTVLETENKRLDEFVKDLKNLQKDKSGYLKALDKAKSAIAKNEGNLEDNEKEQITKMEDIESQKAALESAKEQSLAALSESDLEASQKDAESLVKTEEKRLSSYEREFKKLQKNNDNYNKAIEKAQNSIALNEMMLEINTRDQKNKIKDIEVQKTVIELAKENLKKFIL